MPPAPPDPRRQLPSVDRLLGEPGVARLIGLYGRERVAVAVRRELEALRGELVDASPPLAHLDQAVAELPGRVAAQIEAELGRGLRRVINATGVFLHTNLGRAALPRGAAEALRPLLDAACDLEFDLEAGRRASRNRVLEPLLRALTGAEAALVVNNNAGALLLVLATLAAGRQVVVSRGELIEIGGSFRIPEILAAAGARLVEVGTTNRTRLADYAAAIGPQTALLLKVYPSNYRMSGFVEAVGPEALQDLARRRGVPLLVDEGSGLLRPHRAPQLRGHPSLAELMAAGCDLACGSGDKLLGGPQAGILVGRGDLIERCHRHPLYRALRPDRLALGALEAVLRLHQRGAPLPLDGMWPDPAAHRERLERVAGAIGADVVPADAYLGGGSAPEAPIPGEALALPGDESMQRRLRGGDPPVVGYQREGRLILDLRTVSPSDDEALTGAVRRAQHASRLE